MKCPHSPAPPVKHSLRSCHPICANQRCCLCGSCILDTCCLARKRLGMRNARLDRSCIGGTCRRPGWRVAAALLAAVSAELPQQHPPCQAAGCRTHLHRPPLGAADWRCTRSTSCCCGDMKSRMACRGRELGTRCRNA